MWFTPAHQRRCRPGLRSQTLPSGRLQHPGYPSQRRSGVDTLAEIADNLEGVTPRSPTLTFNHRTGTT